MDDIFPFPTGAKPPADIDRAASIELLNAIKPWIADGRPSIYICECLREKRGRVCEYTDPLAEPLCDWIAELLDHDHGPQGLARYALGTKKYVPIEWRDENQDKMQRTRLAWIDWMIKELSHG